MAARERRFSSSRRVETACIRLSSRTPPVMAPRRVSKVAKTRTATPMLSRFLGSTMASIMPMIRP